MYLNIPPNEDDAAPVEDTTTNIEDNSRNNEESLVNESIEFSHEVYIRTIKGKIRTIYISCINFIAFIFLTSILS
jgi:hypothetical protein